jgi:predicted porin
MKKSLLALTVLGAFSGAVFAQSSVTVYGIVDLGIASERNATQTRTGMLSGIQSGSRIGFKGTEDLGSGLSAIFQLENGFAADTGSASQVTTAIPNMLFGRRATVGLTGGFGAVNLGRRNTPYYNAIDSVDPMATGFAGNAAKIFADTGIRMNNSIIYTSPNFNGVTGEVAYGFGEAPGDTTASRQIGGSIAYVEGPISVALAHHNANTTASVSGKNTVITGKYDFNMAIAHLAYARNTGTTTSTGLVDSNDLLVGLTVPFGAHAVMASYIRKDDKLAVNADAKLASLAYTYSLSKRTNLYASYAKITNDNTAAYKTNGGFGDREANIGIRHKF